MGRFQMMQLRAEEQKNDELAKKVRMATLDQLVAQLEHDMKIVGERVVQDKDASAAESVKDARFLRERQATLTFNLSV